MSREKKDSQMASFKLRSDLIKLLEEYSNKTGITKTRIVEDAIRLYMEKNNN